MTRTDGDVVICGGAVIGAAVAYFLASLRHPGRILLVERDPSFAVAATALAASGIRQQFSDPLNVRISQYGLEVIRAFGLDFHEHGYLTLARPGAQAEALRAAVAAQRTAGAATELLGPDDLGARFAHLATGDLALGAFGPRGEGWFDNMGLLAALRDRARAMGVETVHDAVIGLDLAGDRVVAARLSSGARLACAHLVNAAGGAGADVAAMAGVRLPVERRKRTVFHFETAEPPPARHPLMIDPGGVWCRPEGRGFIAGCTPDPDPEVAADDFAPRHEEFEAVVWPALAARSRLFEALRPGRFWAGHYDFNTFDQNAIVGPHPVISNLYLANGFSGHGLQQAPAVGRAIAEAVVFGRTVSLDLSPLSFARIAKGRPAPERAVI